jgi:hypothetical protein
MKKNRQNLNFAKKEVKKNFLNFLVKNFIFDFFTDMFTIAHCQAAPIPRIGGSGAAFSVSPDQVQLPIFCL